MAKIHGKSVLLGIGMGVILSALLGLIFFLGYKPEMDEVKVRELAKKYGMVDLNDRSEPIGKTTINIVREDTLKDITGKLAELGFVEDPLSFQIKLATRQSEGGIIPGTYEFTGLETEQEIIDTLTGIRQ